MERGLEHPGGDVADHPREVHGSDSSFFNAH